MRFRITPDSALSLTSCVTLAKSKCQFPRAAGRVNETVFQSHQHTINVPKYQHQQQKRSESLLSYLNKEKHTRIITTANHWVIYINHLIKIIPARITTV